jgi:hypothetical protein
MKEYICTFFPSLGAAAMTAKTGYHIGNRSAHKSRPFILHVVVGRLLPEFAGARSWVPVRVVHLLHAHQQNWVMASGGGEERGKRWRKKLLQHVNCEPTSFCLIGSQNVEFNFTRSNIENIESDLSWEILFLNCWFRRDENGWLIYEKHSSNLVAFHPPPSLFIYPYLLSIHTRGLAVAVAAAAAVVVELCLSKSNIVKRSRLYSTACCLSSLSGGRLNMQC